MINLEERKKEIEDTFENVFVKLLRQCKGQEGWSRFIETLVLQEKAMIQEVAKTSLEVFIPIKEALEDGCISDVEMIVKAIIENLKGE